MWKDTAIQVFNTSIVKKPHQSLSFIHSFIGSFIHFSAGNFQLIPSLIHYKHQTENISESVRAEGGATRSTSRSSSTSTRRRGTEESMNREEPIGRKMPRHLFHSFAFICPFFFLSLSLSNSLFSHSFTNRKLPPRFLPSALTPCPSCLAVTGKNKHSERFNRYFIAFKKKKCSHEPARLNHGHMFGNYQHWGLIDSNQSNVVCY